MKLEQDCRQHQEPGTVNPERNLLKHPVRHEAGVQGSFIADAKGYNLYFQDYLDNLSTRERAAVDQMLPALTDWFVQAGSAPMNAAADNFAQNNWLAGDAANDANYDLERSSA